MKILKNFDTKKIVKNKNKILFAIAFIFLLVLLFWSSAFRSFVSMHPGLIGVLIAVSGEVYFDWKEESGKNARLKKFFMGLLVVSLAYELYEASESDKKAADAIELAGESNRKAEGFRLKADELEKQIEQAKTKIDSVDPRKRPIKDASAAVFLTITARDWLQIKRGVEGLTGQLVVFNSSDKKQSRFVFTSKDCSVKIDGGFSLINMSFKFRNLNDDRDFVQDGDLGGLLMNRVEVMDSLDSIRLTVNSDQINGRKLSFSGEVVLFFNSEPKYFSIKEQYFSNSPVVLTNFFAK